MGYYMDDKILQNWITVNLHSAKKILSGFKSLNKLFDNFRKYDKKRLQMNHNMVLGYALPDFNDKKNPNDTKVLESLDYLIEFFQINENQHKDYRDLKKQLTSDNYSESFSAFEELYVANQLSVRFGSKNIGLFPKLAKGKPDILLTLDDKKIFFEVTAPRQNTPEKIVTSILTKVSEHIWKKSRQTDSYLNISFDSSKLVRDSDGDIIEDASIEYLKKIADDLEIHELVGHHDFFDLSTAYTTVVFGELFQKNNKKYGERYNKKFRKYNFPKEWLLKKDSKIIQDGPFKTFVGGTSKGLKIVINSGGNLVSGLGDIEFVGIINKLKQTINSKINETNQFEQESLNILVIRSPASRGYSFPGMESLTEIIKMRCEINKYLKKKTFENLSGVILFSERIDEAKLILNPNAASGSKLDEKTIKKLRFQIHDDNEQYLILGPKKIIEAS